MDWIITKVIIDDSDCLGPEYNRLGYGRYNDQWAPIPKEVRDPAARVPLIEKHLNHPGTDYPFDFRLLDDDGEIYYEGKCGDLDQQSEETAFAPLDWAMADAGCTSMEYKRAGEDTWKQL